MPHLPPLRTRSGTRTEPHISSPPREPAARLAQPEFQVSDPPRAAVTSTPPPSVVDDDYPILTQVVDERLDVAPEPPPLLPHVGRPLPDPQAEEDEMVDRITARILAGLQSDLEDIVALAVREALRRDRG